MTCEVLNPDYARIELAKRHHVNFMDWTWPRRDPFLIGLHTEIIGEAFDNAIAKYRAGESSYLTIKCPVRHGKSDECSRFLPANFIGKFPDQEVIIAAYSYQLSRTFSRFCRDNIMTSPKYQMVYPGVQLSRKNRSTDSWGIENNFGQTHWVGLGGSVTGKGGSCFPAGTMISTSSGRVDIKEIYKNPGKYRLLTCNKGCYFYHKITAVRKIKSDDLVKVETYNHKEVSCTSDHPISYYDTYKPANQLQKRDECIVIGEGGRWIDKDHIRKVENLQTNKTEVYDIHVEKVHNFFANGILVHNCILIDDFYKGRKEAESEVIRSAVWEAVSNDIFTRRAPVSITIILATPWHIDDVFGRIEKKQKENPEFPQFEELKFPAFGGYRNQDGKHIEYSGGVLFPERFSLSWYQAERAVLGPYATAGLLNCEPTARGGNQFEVDRIKKYDIPPDDVKWCRGWDLASSEVQRIGEDPDYTVGAKVGVRWITIGDGKQLPEIYVDDINEGRWAAPKRNKIIEGVTISDGSSTQVAIESFGAYKDAYIEIKKALHGIRVVKKMQLSGDKTSKASVLEAPIAAGNFHIRRAPWNDRFLAQFRAFPGGAHDDQVDSVVVGFEGHDPYERRVWPQIQKKHIVDLQIDWEKTKSDISGSVHYAGMWQKEDLSVWVVQVLWDVYTGYLFIYNAFMCEQPTPNTVVPALIHNMKLKDFKCESIICNSLMWEQKGYSKNVALQYRNNFNKRNMPVKIKEAFNYDEYGSIVETGQIFDTDMARIDAKAYSLILQLMSWVTVDTGRRTGHKPDDTDNGFCKALCLIVSELRRRERYVEVMTPKFNDYNKENIVKDTYQIAGEKGRRRTSPTGVGV